MLMGYFNNLKNAKKTTTNSAIFLLEAMKTVHHNSPAVDGYYKEASFEALGRTYIMNEFGQLYVYKNNKFKPVATSFGTNGAYPDYNLGSEYNKRRYVIKAYVLSLCLLKQDAFEQYMSDKNCVINHTVITKSDYYLSQKPLSEVSFNPRYLEIITRRQNSLHGNVVRNYDLHNLYVSAYDIPNLLELFYNEERINKNNPNFRGIVKNYYKDLNMRIEF